MDFDNRLKQLFSDSLKQLLTGLTRPCYESELIKAAFHLDDIPTDALELYQIHFVLFNQLYKLQNLYAEQNLYLHIHFMRTFLLPYPPEGLCRHYDPEGFFCRTETKGYYCDFHRKPEEDKALEAVSARYFYLDRDNYNSISADQAEDFIRGTWELMTSWDKVEEARKILGLSGEFNGKILRDRFKKLAKSFHPDTAGKLNTGKEGEFIKINNAYCFLKKIQGYMS